MEQTYSFRRIAGALACDREEADKEDNAFVGLGHFLPESLVWPYHGRVVVISSTEVMS